MQSKCSWQDGSEGDQAGRPTIEEVNSDGIQRVINLQPHQWYSAPCTEYWSSFWGNKEAPAQLARRPIQKVAQAGLVIP